MKNLFTIFIFSLLVFTSKAQWVELDPGVDDSLYDVYAITPDIVVVVGANGTILKTTDGGETWVQKFSGTVGNLIKVQFPTPQIGFVLAAGSKLLRTTDGGETWSQVDTGVDCNYDNFSCVDENLIFIACNWDLKKTEDGGQTWINIGSLDGGRYIQFLNDEIGYTGEHLLGLSKTEDGGSTWQEIEGEATTPFYFINEHIGFAYLGGLLKTTNGYDFSWVSPGDWFELEAIYAINENVIWGILHGTLDWDPSTRGIIKITSSDTETYVEEIAWDGSPEINMFSIHFADETTGYVTGRKNGVPKIWKNGTGINEFPDENVNTNEVTAILFKAYPNPAIDEIHVELTQTEDFTLSLSDLSGKQVYTDSFKGNKITINTGQFPKGIYILSVETKQKKQSQKIIIH